jgi:hypothetical protein
MQINGLTFFIRNQDVWPANIAQWGTDNGNDCGTYEEAIYPDQLWMFLEDEFNPGYYNIMNVYHSSPPWRLAKWGEGNTDTGVYAGDYYEDQLWSFVNVSESATGEGMMYNIYNKAYPQCKLTQWGQADSDWGTETGNVTGQTWTLLSRFTGTIQIKTLWSADNRQGTQDFSETVTVTEGLKLTSSSSVSVKLGLDESLKASIPDIGMSVKTQLQASVTDSLDRGEEESWTQTTSIKFTAPAGKNYRVSQYTVPFKSLYDADDMTLSSFFSIQESDGELPHVDENGLHYGPSTPIVIASPLPKLI